MRRTGGGRRRRGGAAAAPAPAGGLPILTSTVAKEPSGGSAGRRRGVGRDPDEDRGAAAGDRVGGRGRVGVGEGDGAGEARLARPCRPSRGFSSSAKVPLASCRAGHGSASSPRGGSLARVDRDQFAALDRQRVAAGGRVGVDDGALQGLAFRLRFFFRRGGFGRRLGRLGFRRRFERPARVRRRFERGAREDRRSSSGASLASAAAFGEGAGAAATSPRPPPAFVRTPRSRAGTSTICGAAPASVPEAPGPIATPMKRPKPSAIALSGAAQRRSVTTIADAAQHSPVAAFGRPGELAATRHGGDLARPTPLCGIRSVPHCQQKTAPRA